MGLPPGVPPMGMGRGSFPGAAPFPGLPAGNRFPMPPTSAGPLPPSPAAAHGVRQPLFPVADYQENTSAASKSSATTAAASSMLTAPNQILIYDDLETSMEEKRAALQKYHKDEAQSTSIKDLDETIGNRVEQIFNR